MRRLGHALLLLLLVALVALGTSVLSWQSSSPVARLEADHIRVDKSARRLELLRGGEVIRSYRVSLGRNPRGHKQREGDARTPEGSYHIDGRNSRSRFHRALHISYPDAQDRRAASQQGVSPGGDIMIHGIRNGWGWAWPFFKLFDWTDGCIAVNNREMDEIWQAVPTGTPIEIEP